MAKGKKVTKASVAAMVAPVVTEVASTATKLTKRNATPLDKALVATDKPQRSRAPHVVAAWDAVKAALPATAAELAKLEPLQDAKCVSPQAFLSYMLRRGYLAVKGE
jgi:hypothetical protein